MEINTFTWWIVQHSVSLPAEVTFGITFFNVLIRLACSVNRLFLTTSLDL